MNRSVESAKIATSTSRQSLEKSSNKKSGPNLSALYGKKQKWTFSSRIKNLFDAGRKERKLADRALIAASVTSHTTIEDKFRAALVKLGHDNSITGASEFGADELEPGPVFVGNPLYNPHLDNSGDNRVHQLIGKRVGQLAGQRLLDTFKEAKTSSNTVLSSDRVHYHFGQDKADVKTRDFIIASIGMEAASHFSVSASGAWAAAMLKEINHSRDPSPSIPLENVVSVDWTFERGETGAVTASYELKFKGHAWELAKARGTVEVNQEGQLSFASRIHVTGLEP